MMAIIITIITVHMIAPKMSPAPTTPVARA